MSSSEDHKDDRDLPQTTPSAADETAPPEDDRSSREESFTRRGVLRAGWIVPTVIALETALPKQVSAGFSNTFNNFSNRSTNNPRQQG